MLTRVVRLSLALELAAWIALAAWLRTACRIEWPAIAVLVLAAPLLTRFGLVCITVSLGWRYRSARAPAQRLGPWGAIRLVASEFRALLADNFWYLPFEGLALRADPASVPPGRVPVVLVHGYLSNRGYWAP